MSRSKGVKNKVPLHTWSDEEKEYLSEITPGRHYSEIHEMMNDKFEYRFTYEQIKAAIKRYKLNTGFTGQYEKGNIPFNKGTKGVCKSNKTSFQKGNIPQNKKEVGSERITKDGYTEVKVEEPNKWNLKHRVLYEKYHDVKLIRDDIIIFLNGNKQNLNKENLHRITREQLVRLNQFDLIKEDKDLTKVGINIASVIAKYGKLSRNKKAR